MGTRLFHLNSMAAKERTTIRLMRGAKGAAIPDNLGTNFDTLRNCAGASGMFILEDTSTFVGPDEMKLIAWLTAYQRERVDLVWNGSPELNASVRACAKGLDGQGIRLDYRHVVRTGEPSRSASSDHPSGTGSSGDTPAHPEDNSLTRLRLAPRSLQLRVLDIIEQRGAARMRELSALGISRQIMSAMCKRGLVHRSRHGLYVIRVSD
jgi:hypothetical protein